MSVQDPQVPKLSAEKAASLLQSKFPVLKGNSPLEVLDDFRRRGAALGATQDDFDELKTYVEGYQEPDGTTLGGVVGKAGTFLKSAGDAAFLNLPSMAWEGGSKLLEKAGVIDDSVNFYTKNELENSPFARMGGTVLGTAVGLGKLKAGLYATQKAAALAGALGKRGLAAAKIAEYPTIGAIQGLSLHNQEQDEIRQSNATGVADGTAKTYGAAALGGALWDAAPAVKAAHGVRDLIPGLNQALKLGRIPETGNPGFLAKRVLDMGAPIAGTAIEANAMDIPLNSQEGLIRMGLGLGMSGAGAYMGRKMPWGDPAARPVPPADAGASVAPGALTPPPPGPKEIGLREALGGNTRQGRGVFPLAEPLDNPLVASQDAARLKLHEDIAAILTRARDLTKDLKTTGARSSPVGTAGYGGQARPMHQIYADDSHMIGAGLPNDSGELMAKRLPTARVEDPTLQVPMRGKAFKFRFKDGQMPDMERLPDGAGFQEIVDGDNRVAGVVVGMQRRFHGDDIAEDAPPILFVADPRTMEIRPIQDPAADGLAPGGIADFSRKQTQIMNSLMAKKSRAVTGDAPAEPRPVVSTEDLENLPKMLEELQALAAQFSQNATQKLGGVSAAGGVQPHTRVISLDQTENGSPSRMQRGQNGAGQAVHPTDAPPIGEVRSLDQVPSTPAAAAIPPSLFGDDEMPTSVFRQGASMVTPEGPPAAGRMTLPQPRANSDAAYEFMKGRLGVQDSTGAMIERRQRAGAPPAGMAERRASTPVEGSATVAPDVTGVLQQLGMTPPRMQALEAWLTSIKAKPFAELSDAEKVKALQVFVSEAEK